MGAAMALAGSPPSSRPRMPVCLHHQFAQYPSVLILPSQHIQERRPQRRVLTEPVGIAGENLAMEQALVAALMQLVLPILPVAEAVGLRQRAVPRMPTAPFAPRYADRPRSCRIVQERGVGDRCCPGFGRRLGLQVWPREQIRTAKGA